MRVDFNLILISDRKIIPTGTLWARLKRALRAGLPAFQLREKDLCDKSLYAMALKARALTRRYGCKLIINGRWDIAKAVDADGVHLPENSLPISVVRKALGVKAIIGKSAHALASARKAQRDGADYISFGPVFDTPSKRGFGPPQGLARLKEVCNAVKIPVFALGGINKNNASQVLARGAWGIATIRGVDLITEIK